jgi:hypothetical protein
LSSAEAAFVPLWSRPAFQPSGQTAHVLVVSLFGSDKLIDLGAIAITPETGAPVEAQALLDQVELEWMPADALARAIFMTPLWSFHAMNQLEPEVRRALAATPGGLSIRMTREDPKDLGHLQLARAITIALERLGAVGHVDVLSQVWSVAPTAPRAALGVLREIGVFVESEARGGFGHAINTRGMAKLGRPELITTIEDVERERVEEAVSGLRDLIELLALGRVVEAGDRVPCPKGGPDFEISFYFPGVTAPPVHFDEDERVLQVARAAESD